MGAASWRGARPPRGRPRRSRARRCRSCRWRSCRSSRAGRGPRTGRRGLVADLLVVVDAIAELDLQHLRLRRRVGRVAAGRIFLEVHAEVAQRLDGLLGLLELVADVREQDGQRARSRRHRGRASPRPRGRRPGSSRSPASPDRRRAACPCRTGRPWAARARDPRRERTPVRTRRREKSPAWSPAYHARCLNRGPSLATTSSCT